MVNNILLTYFNLYILLGWFTWSRTLLNDLLMIYLITINCTREVISVAYRENFKACSADWIFNARDQSIENILIKGV